MNLDVLKIDIDYKSKKKSINQLKERLSYMNDLGFFDIDTIIKIELIKKTNYAAKIYLSKNLKPHFLIIMQLLLGSDYMKEVNTMINHYMLGMEYANRMFDIKRYPGGEYKSAILTDITKEVIEHINDKSRKRFKN